MEMGKGFHLPVTNRSHLFPADLVCVEHECRGVPAKENLTEVAGNHVYFVFCSYLARDRYAALPSSRMWRQLRRLGSLQQVLAVKDDHWMLL